MAEDDLWVQQQLRAGATLPPKKYLTPGHGPDRMGVRKETDPARNGNVSELPKCQCLSRYEMVTEPNDDPTDDTVSEIKVWSSCGSTVPKRKRFKPGHDAKLKSTLQKLFRDGEDLHYYEGGMMISTSPMDHAIKLGWEKFMTPKPTKSKAKAKSGQVIDGGKLRDETTTEFDDDGEVIEGPTATVGFVPAQVKVGRWWKDGKVVEETETALTVEYAEKRGKSVKRETVNKSDTDRYKIG
jgi:hypothetical protein